MRCSLAPLALLAVVACSLPRELDEYPAFHARMAERYGPMHSNMNFGESPRLDLEMTGRRWRGFQPGRTDSAKAIARYALESFPAAWPRPDTITIRFRIQDMNLIVFRSRAWLGDTIAVTDL
jgi:hypothetical protein